MPTLINPLLDALPELPPPSGTFGLPWFEAGDYAELRRVMNDGAGLPALFDDWLGAQREREAELLAQGRQVCRVVIRPREFLEWCDGFTLPNQAACLIYAALRAKELRPAGPAPAATSAVREALRAVIASARETDEQARAQPAQGGSPGGGHGAPDGENRGAGARREAAGRSSQAGTGVRAAIFSEPEEPLSPAPARLERRYAGLARWE